MGPRRQCALPPPGCFPRRTTQGAHWPPAEPWLPGAKLTRSDKAWVGAGTGSAAGKRACGRRIVRRKMLWEPVAPVWAGRVDSRSQGAQWFLQPAEGPAGRGRGGRGEEGGHPAQQAAPSQYPLPSASGCPLSGMLMHFPGGIQPSAWQLRSEPGSAFQGVDSDALPGSLALWREHCFLSWTALA